MTLMAQAPQDPASGSIEGIALSIVNGAPVEGARLRLGATAESPYPASEYREIPEAVTGADGKFVLSGLKAAVYIVVIDGNGWVQQRYGQNTFPGEGTPLVLTPGQALKGITVRLTPTGVVSGTIRQADTRQATAGVPVQLMRVTYDTQGERTLQQAGIASTNDRGEFRLLSRRGAWKLQDLRVGSARAIRLPRSRPFSTSRAKGKSHSTCRVCYADGGPHGHSGQLRIGDASVLELTSISSPPQLLPSICDQSTVRKKFCLNAPPPTSV